MTPTAGPAAGNAVWWYPEDHDSGDWVAWANSLPFCRDLGLRCVEFTAASALFIMDRPALTPNPNGAVNGGIVVAAADQVMGAMTLRVSQQGMLPATGSLHIQYHRPALAPITFRAVPLGGGRRTKFIEVIVEDRYGNRCATSQGTMIAGGSNVSRGEPD
ncbi:hypothetical protein BST36_23480 [Mycolicibacterium moriokaense]|nr:PaaI family thioesterase [Mycolicibacterium moriokaense]MCV7039158.1 PaaI family thioesterase [Mycolicibacterium moriokaense]ORB18557.1 hypothetical protein BST36_23480 [Mycolicibacterium moriokaense]